MTLDLLVRFTDSPNPQAKEQGIYKFTKGIVRGWQLEEAEANRVANVGDASEVVLLRRPAVIYVEVPTANNKLEAYKGKKIYCLKLSVTTWSLGPARQVLVRRYGFPIVPDFGGTAHA